MLEDPLPPLLGFQQVTQRASFFLDPRSLSTQIFKSPLPCLPRAGLFLNLFTSVSLLVFYALCWVGKHLIYKQVISYVAL